MNRLSPYHSSASEVSTAVATALPGRSFLRRPLPLESETCWLLLLGVLDLVLTTVLLGTGLVHEANPVARVFLFAGGLHGLIAYKCGLLTVAAVAVQVITLRRPRVARGILFVGIAAHLLVVGYSCALLFKLA